MKNILLIASLAVCIACNNGKENKTEIDADGTDIKTEKTKSTASSENGLQQKGDYSSLFDSASKDCSFISGQQIADALSVSVSTVEQGENECTYYLLEPNGNRTRFYFTVEPWKNKTILKEIKTAKKNAEMFGKDSKLSQYRISETSDSYLVMHQNRMIKILNERANGAIILLYSSEADKDGTGVAKDATLKDEARERAYTISNAILKKYQK